MDPKAMQNEIKNSKIRQGPLYKRSKFLKEWRERWIVLTMNYLFTFTNKTCKQVTDVIDLKEVKSYKSYVRKDEEMIPAGFKIRSQDNEFYFCGRNANEKWTWLVTLERLMDYKYVGSSTYNNVDFIRTRGFMSQVDFENGGKVEKTAELPDKKGENKKSAEEAKKEVDSEIERIMKELEAQKEQLKQKEQEFSEKEKNLKGQQEELAKQRQQEEELQAKKEETVKQPEPVEGNKQSAPEKKESKPVAEVNPNSVVSQMKSMFEQKMAESSKQTGPSIKLAFETIGKKMNNQKSKADELASYRSKTVTNLFEEFHGEEPEPNLLLFTLDFLVKISSDQKFGYMSSVIAEVKTHKNKEILSEIFVELVTDYHDLDNCHLLANFIEICVINSPGFFSAQQLTIIQNKMGDFLLRVENENSIEVLLKSMFIMNKMNKAGKNEQLKGRLNRIIKDGKHEPSKNWARKLVDEF